MPSLTVHFRGICTHFSHLVPGIPHRVVLPNATALRFGLVDMPDAPQTLPYVLLPHFAVLRVHDDAAQARLNVPGVMLAGLIYDRVRLSVANAIGNRVEYQHKYHDVAHLAHYVHAYQFSEDVVLGGRASCYFDVTSGTAAPYFIGEKIAGVVITIQTEGPPVLLATPFFETTSVRPEVSRIDLPPGDDVELLVGNIGPGCGDEGADGFDFLLNYLTLRGGIPRHLRHRPPRAPVSVEPFHRVLAAAFESFTHIQSPSEVRLPDYYPMLFSPTLSCSNSQYP